MNFGKMISKKFGKKAIFKRLLRKFSLTRHREFKSKLFSKLSPFGDLKKQLKLILKKSSRRVQRTYSFAVGCPSHEKRQLKLEYFGIFSNILAVFAHLSVGGA